MQTKADLARQQAAEQWLKGSKASSQPCPTCEGKRFQVAATTLMSIDNFQVRTSIDLLLVKCEGCGNIRFFEAPKDEKPKPA